MTPAAGSNTPPAGSGRTFEWYALRLALLLIGIWLLTDLTPLDLVDMVFGSGRHGPTWIQDYNHRRWWEEILDGINGCRVPGTCHGQGFP